MEIFDSCTFRNYMLTDYVLSESVSMWINAIWFLTRGFCACKPKIRVIRVRTKRKWLYSQCTTMHCYASLGVELSTRPRPGHNDERFGRIFQLFFKCSKASCWLHQQTWSDKMSCRERERERERERSKEVVYFAGDKGPISQPLDLQWTNVLSTPAPWHSWDYLRGMHLRAPLREIFSFSLQYAFFLKIDEVETKRRIGRWL